MERKLRDNSNDCEGHQYLRDESSNGNESHGFIGCVHELTGRERGGGQCCS